jgi:phosphoserine phosphatase
MTSTAEPVWLFDLDGTLLEVNSFPLWVSQLLTGGLPHLTRPARLGLSLRCAAAIAERKVLRLSHVRFKRRLQRLWKSAAADDSAAAAPLIERLLSHVRPSFKGLLADVAAGRVDALLTTAAAAEYALPLARQLGFRHIIATPAGGLEHELDNVGEAKRDRTLAYLAARGWEHRTRIFFTDHCDDLPLIRECHAVVWLGNDHDYGRVRGECGGRELLCARTLAADALHRWVLAQPRERSAACT